MVYPKEEIESANERAAARLAKTPTATAARYDSRIGRLGIDLSSGPDGARAGGKAACRRATRRTRNHGRRCPLLSESRLLT